MSEYEFFFYNTADFACIANAQGYFEIINPNFEKILGYSKKELLIFGFGTGLATFLFMGTSVILFSLVKGGIPILLIQILNVAVGCLLIGYGGIRLIKGMKLK